MPEFTGAGAAAAAAAAQSTESTDSLDQERLEQAISASKHSAEARKALDDARKELNQRFNELLEAEGGTGPGTGAGPGVGPQIETLYKSIQEAVKQFSLTSAQYYASNPGINDLPTLELQQTDSASRAFNDFRACAPSTKSSPKRQAFIKAAKACINTLTYPEPSRTHTKPAATTKQTVKQIAPTRAGNAKEHNTLTELPEDWRNAIKKPGATALVIDQKYSMLFRDKGIFSREIIELAKDRINRMSGKANEQALKAYNALSQKNKMTA